MTWNITCQNLLRRWQRLPDATSAPNVIHFTAGAIEPLHLCIIIFQQQLFHKKNLN